MVLSTEQLFLSQGWEIINYGIWSTMVKKVTMKSSFKNNRILLYFFCHFFGPIEGRGHGWTLYVIFGIGNQQEDMSRVNLKQVCIMGIVPTTVGRACYVSGLFSKTFSEFPNYFQELIDNGKDV